MNSCAASCCTCFRMAFVRIRHFGFLANRRRADFLPLCFQLLGLAATPPTGQDTSSANNAKRSLVLPQVCWTDGGRREVHRCRDATSSPTSGHRRMKQLSTSRTLCVFGNGPSLLALSPNKFLLPASSGTLFTIFFRTSQLPGASCHPLCSAPSPQHTSTSPLRSIQFA